MAKIEHDSVVEALGIIGARVVRCASAKNWQDSVYTANWAFCRRDVALMARLPNARKGEVKHAERILRGLGKQIIHPPRSIERYSGQGTHWHVETFFSLVQGIEQIQAWLIICNTFGQIILSCLFRLFRSSMKTAG